MAMMSIFGSSASASTDAAIGKTLTSEFIVSNVVGQAFSPDVAAQIREVDGVAGVTQLRQAFPDIDGGFEFVAAMDPQALGFAFAIPMEDGSLADLGPGTVAVTPGRLEQGPGGRRQRHHGLPGRQAGPAGGGDLRDHAGRPATTSSRSTPWSRAGSRRWTRWCS